MFESSLCFHVVYATIIVSMAMAYGGALRRAFFEGLRDCSVVFVVFIAIIFISKMMLPEVDLLEVRDRVHEYAIAPTHLSPWVAVVFVACCVSCFLMRCAVSRSTTKSALKHYV